MRHASAIIDHSAIASNIATAQAITAGADVMIVVKADAYGHGAADVARTARESGVTRLGVAFPGEALALRASGDTGGILAWLYSPDDPDVRACVDAEVELSVGSTVMLEQIAAAARVAGRRARIHAKADTGLSRGGSTAQAWPVLVDAIAREQAAGTVELIGTWTHLANADLPGHPSIAEQSRAFTEAVDVVTAAGLEPGLRHLANSPATFLAPQLHADLVRVGIATYGVDFAEPGSAVRAGLVPAMTVIARIAMVKTIPAGASVSYGSTWTASRPTRVALLPIGYADGLPRSASGKASVVIAGRRQPIVGRIAMDQCVVALDDDLVVAEGDAAVLFGDTAHGAPSAGEWAEAADTIGYEIVTRMGPRLAREHRR